jgi:hypothetical protein
MVTRHAELLGQRLECFPGIVWGSEGNNTVLKSLTAAYDNGKDLSFTPLPPGYPACSVSSQSMWIEWDWMGLNPKQVKLLLNFF